VVVRDVAMDEGEVVEITDDWYAQDLDGNVWYCGEIAQNFELFEGDEPEVPELVAHYLSKRQLPMQGVCWPALAPYGWHSVAIDMQTRAARGDDLVGVTGAFAGIAETGTLMLLSGPETPATVSLLPETHVAVLESGRIVANMEQAWDRLRVERGTLPRAVNFVSGPSRTADIEQTVTLGAHGPYRVLIIIVG